MDDQGHGCTPYAVSLGGVHHAFRGKPALNGLDLTAPWQKVTVLLGPNGAGKTTAFRAITGALEPDEGTIASLGLDPIADGRELRNRCGVVSAKPALYDRLSGLENLLFAAELYGLGRKVEDKARSVAARFGILDAVDDLVGGYSTGMKTRLALARSIIHDPELVLFDEPTSGLDPESAHAVLGLIREMANDGATVIMCTHLLAEAEGLADHIVMMEAGSAIVSGAPDELINHYWPYRRLEIEAEDPRILDRIAGWPGVRHYRRPTDVAHVELDPSARVPDMIASLVHDGARLVRIDPHRPTLEDLYFSIRRHSMIGDTEEIAKHQGLAPIEWPAQGGKIDELEAHTMTSGLSQNTSLAEMDGVSRSRAHDSSEYLSGIEAR